MPHLDNIGLTNGTGRFLSRDDPLIRVVIAVYIEYLLRQMLSKGLSVLPSDKHDAITFDVTLRWNELYLKASCDVTVRN